VYVSDIDELAASWQAAEERLYPVVLTRPEAYARSLELVRAVVDEISAIGTLDGLAQAYADVAEIAAAAAGHAGVETEDLDLGLIAAAGFALRYREVRRELSLQHAIEAIASARRSGEQWVIVSESGNPDRVGYVLVEMHVPSGSGLRAGVGADAETGSLRFSLESLRLDPRTGSPLEQTEGTSLVTYEDREAWDKGRQMLKARLSETR
jgi:hypothetical protein